MTTDKHRITVYMNDRRPLDTLTKELRQRVPIEARGLISRSTAVEAAVRLALDVLRAKGRDAAIFQAMVTLPGGDE